MGEVIREDISNNSRLFCWPCPYGCRAGAVALVRVPMSLAKAQKAARKMVKFEQQQKELANDQGSD